MKTIKSKGSPVGPEGIQRDIFQALEREFYTYNLYLKFLITTGLKNVNYPWKTLVKEARVLWASPKIQPNTELR